MTRPSKGTLIGELKRRNVFRVAAVYLATAWLVVHVGYVFGQTFGIPSWVMRFVILLLALGFPCALAFSWAFEVTPKGLKRTHHVPASDSITHSTGRKLDFAIIGVLVAALAFVVLDVYVFTDRGHRASNATGEVVSIAVLAFADLSPAGDNEYFSDGISEELLNRLAKVDRFRVTGRTSSFAFKGKDEDLRAIGEKLGVESILEGSVRKQGDRVRITAQLISVADGSYLWSDRFDRNMSDVFEIQDDIADSVATALQRTLLIEDGTAGGQGPNAYQQTSSFEAYNSFLRGHFLLRKRLKGEMEQALIEFRHAIESDPGFARAHVGLARAYLHLAGYGHRNIADVKSQAEAAIAHALELKPDLAEAFAAKYLLLNALNDESGQDLQWIRRAVALNPGDAQANQWLAIELEMRGRPVTETLPLYERAYAIDPLAPNIIHGLADDLFEAGDRDRAILIAGEIEAFDPARYNMLRAAFADFDGRLDESIRWLSRSISEQPDQPDTLVTLAIRYEMLGDTISAKKHCGRALELSPGNTRALAHCAYVGLESGRTAPTLKLLDDGLQRFPDNGQLRIARAWYDYYTGASEQALHRFQEAIPMLFRDPPTIQFGFSYEFAVEVSFLERQVGNASRAALLADQFLSFTSSTERPAWKVSPEFWRARMAAAMGDRAGVLSHLRNIYERGSAIAAWVQDEPMLRPYARDAEIATLFSKHAARRAEWRVQLASEGL